MASYAQADGGNFAGTEILEEGIRLLCKNDPGTQRLIAPRYAQIISLLRGYIAEIETHNPALGLVGTSDRQGLVKRHILDSLAPLGIFCRLLEEQAAAGSGAIPSIADVGSGAGLPGIPLAAALPQVHFTLIERMGRRAGFLRDTVKALALSNVTVAEDELEKFAHNVIMRVVQQPAGRNAVSQLPDRATDKAPGGFSLVTFRAFRPFEPKIIKGLLRLCAGGGVIAAYKGRREKIEEEISALKKYFAGPAAGQKIQAAGYEIIPCPAPLLDEERHILLIRVLP